MNEFEFALPTKVYFGRKKYQAIGDILKEYNVVKVLLTTGVGSAKKSGLLAEVKQLIAEAGITVFILEGIEPNPSTNKVYQGLKIIRDEQIDFIVALGGGSVIDASKLMALGAKYEGDIIDILNYHYQPFSRIGIGVILTNAAAGSETSNSLVVSDPITKRKIGVNSELNRPDFALLSPDLTLSINKETTAAGIFDIYMHTFERLMSKDNQTENYIDLLAITTLNRIILIGEQLINDLENYSLREEMMLLGMISHNGLMGLGKDVEMPIHKLEHAISGLYPVIPHGTGLAMLFRSFLEKTQLDRFYQETFHQQISLVYRLIDKLGLNLSYQDFGIKVDLDALAQKVLQNQKSFIIKNHHLNLDYDLLVQIFNI